MPLQSSGQITLNQIHKEAGGAGGTQASLNDADIRGLINKASGAQMAMSEWYEASANVLDFSTDLPVASAWRSTGNNTYGSVSGITNGNDWNMQPKAKQNTTTYGELFGGIVVPAGNYEIDYDITLTLNTSLAGSIQIGYVSGTKSGFNVYQSNNSVRQEVSLFTRNSNAGFDTQRIGSNSVSCTGDRVSGTANYTHGSTQEIGIQGVCNSGNSSSTTAVNIVVHSLVIRNA